LQTGIALYLPLSIFFIRNIKALLGVTAGEGLGILPIFLSSFFIVSPLSIFDGAEFPFGCRLLQQKNIWRATSKVYILEAAGFILAGPVFTFLILKGFNSFLIAFYLGVLNLLSAFLLLKIKKVIPVYILLAILFLGLLILHPFLADKLHFLSLRKQWNNQNVLAYQNSLYANLVAIKTQEQITFYSDGIPIITTPHPDTTFIEDISHFSLLNHPEPKRVLILSGGAGGIIREVLKHPVEKVIYTELDPKIIDLVLRFPTELTEKELKNPRLEIKYIDGRRFLKTALDKFDVIILNLSLPTTLQLNRFYTREFFQQIKLHLTEKGIFIFSLPGSLSYLSKEIINLNSIILETLKDIFYVRVIPGDHNLYLAGRELFEIKPDLLLS
ncbi:MAG: hypothetical protein N2Z79_01825, partial [Candidatus Omnitrophica bacterium]|nr:hypothetical protein [Candidatus Omnitrophota bacterium]